MRAPVFVSVLFGAVNRALYRVPVSERSVVFDYRTALVQHLVPRTHVATFATMATISMAVER